MTSRTHGFHDSDRSTIEREYLVFILSKFPPTIALRTSRCELATSNTHGGNRFLLFPIDPIASRVCTRHNVIWLPTLLSIYAQWAEGGSESKLIETTFRRWVRQSNVMRMSCPIRIERFTVERRVSRQRPGFRLHRLALMITWIVIVVVIAASRRRAVIMLSRSASTSSACTTELCPLLLDRFLLTRTVCSRCSRRHVIKATLVKLFLLLMQMWLN